MRKLIWTFSALASLALAIKQSAASFDQYFEAEAWAVQAIFATIATAIAIGSILRVTSRERRIEGDIAFVSHAIAITFFASTVLFWIAVLSVFLKASLHMQPEVRSVYSVIYFGTMIFWSFDSIQVLDRALRKAAEKLGILGTSK